MKSNIVQIVSIKYKPNSNYIYNFIHRSYVGLDEDGALDYDECPVSERWVFNRDNCPYYKKYTSECLYSGVEYPYPLNKYGDTELSVGYWK